MVARQNKEGVALNYGVRIDLHGEGIFKAKSNGCIGSEESGHFLLREEAFEDVF